MGAFFTSYANYSVTCDRNYSNWNFYK